MNKIEIGKASEKHIVPIAKNMRDIDKKEISVSGVNETPYDSLQYAYNKSVKAYTIIIDDNPVVMFGVVNASLLANYGIVWCLGSDNINRIKKTFIQKSKAYIEECLKGYKYVEIYVWIENKLSIKWLKWCGFKFDEPCAIGKHKADRKSVV